MWVMGKSRDRRLIQDGHSGKRINKNSSSLIHLQGNDIMVRFKTWSRCGLTYLCLREGPAKGWDELLICESLSWPMTTNLVLIRLLLPTWGLTPLSPMDNCPHLEKWVLFWMIFLLLKFKMSQKKRIRYSRGTWDLVRQILLEWLTCWPTDVSWWS